jgi:hypothetical protein
LKLWDHPMQTPSESQSFMARVVLFYLPGLPISQRFPTGPASSGIAVEPRYLHILHSAENLEKGERCHSRPVGPAADLKGIQTFGRTGWFEEIRVPSGYD